VSDPVHSPIESHVSAAGPVTEYHGALLPAWYSDPVAEHHAARSAAGLFDFSFRARFTARGSDRVRFIQGMVTNDVKGLVAGQGTYATMLDARGHILADLRIYCAEDHFILDTDVNLLEKAMQSLNRYNIGGRTPLEPLDVSALAIQGPGARRILEESIETSLPVLPEFGHFMASSGAEPVGPVRIIRAENAGEEGYEIWVAKTGVKAVWDGLVARGKHYGLCACGTSALESLRIEAGIPKYGFELAEDVLPLEAGLLNAISFTKGCYLGQEIVERARSRGHVNWKLAGLKIESRTVPPRGEKLMHDGKETGEVTSACLSPTVGNVIALAYLRREVADPGVKLTLASGAGAEVASLPFYQRLKASA
jgi:glycine cleavage system T protein